jgi:LEA14-like dessication related protein
MKIFGIALCALSVLCGGCELLKSRPTAEIVGIKLDRLSLDKADLVVDVNVHNPYQFDMPLANVEYAMSSGGTEFLKSVAELQGQAVPGMGSKVVSVPVEVPFLNLLKVLLNVRSGKVISYETDMKLWADVPGVGPVGIPMKRKSELPIPALPVISLEGIKIDKRSMALVTGALKVRMKNVNEFPLDLEKMNYALKVAGAEIVKGDLEKAMTLAAGGEEVVEIPISFKPLGMAPALLKILAEGGKADYELGGGLDFNTKWGKITMPFTRKGETSLTGP